VSKFEQAINELTYDAAGLIPAVCVDAETKQVLQVAYMNAASLAKTFETGLTHFWSRSRNKMWMKGETSGHTQQVKAIYTDCDKDTLLIEVVQTGGACHEGYYSCFYRRIDEQGAWQVIAEKVFDPDQVYKTRE